MTWASLLLLNDRFHAGVLLLQEFRHQFALPSDDDDDTHCAKLKCQVGNIVDQGLPQEVIHDLSPAGVFHACTLPCSHDHGCKRAQNRSIVHVFLRISLSSNRVSPNRTVTTTSVPRGSTSLIGSKVSG